MDKKAENNTPVENGGSSLELELKESFDAVSKSLDATTTAFANGVEKINQASERFSEKAPGKRASWLGFLLIVSGVSVEVFQAFNKLGFDFSDAMALGMLTIGGVMVLFGVAFDTYFTIKIAAIEQARAESLEKAAAEVMEQAKAAREQQSSVLKKLIGG